MVEFCLTCGLPATGKTTWAKEKVDEGYVWLSSDEIRKAHNYDISNGQVFNQMYVDTVKYLNAGCNVIYDATNINSKRRRTLVSSLKAAVHSEIVLFKCEVFIQPDYIILSRNEKREGKEYVPETAIHRMLTQFQFPQYFEGWDSIVLNPTCEGMIFKTDWMKGFDQKNPHHELDLFEHSFAAAREAGKLYFGGTVHEAAWYHDIGKMSTQVFDDNGVAHYYGHENVSAYYYALHCISEGCGNLNLDKGFFEVVFLINYHMRPYNWTQQSYERDEELFGEKYCRQLKLLHACDIAAH